MGLLVITHYQRLLNHIVPEFVHIWRTAASSAPAARNWPWSWNSKGYDWVRKEMLAGAEAKPSGPSRLPPRLPSSSAAPRGAHRLEPASLRRLGRPPTKNEPDWMRDFRLKLRSTSSERSPMPKWGAALSGIDFDNIHYYIKPTESSAPGTTCPSTSRTRSTSSASPRPRRSSWPAWRAVRFRSGLPQPPRGPRKKGVIFLDMDTGLREHPKIWCASTSARSFRRTTTSSRR
jgi:hypothetical protein